MNYEVEVNADIRPWVQVWEAASSADASIFRALVSQLDGADIAICCICAVWCGAQWQAGPKANFRPDHCPCCGEYVNVTEAKHWKWSEAA